MSKETPVTLASARYAESGISAADAKKLDLKVLPPAQSKRLGFEPRAAIQIPYFNPRAPKEPLSGWPGSDPFYRIRYLGSPPAGLADQTKSKERRYSQPPDSGICAYFSPLVDWSKILDDPAIPILITEGEFKAIKTCKEGFACIGLGGVSNFQSKEQGLTLLKELRDVKWKGRYVYIIYDSDFRTNENICRAIKTLAELLQQLGARPLTVMLPELGAKGKTGLDDFLVSEGADALDELLNSAQPLTLSEPLWELNEEVVYIHNPGFVLTTETMQKMSPSAFKEHAYSSTEYAERVMKADGRISLKPVPIGPAWMAWPMRREAGRLTYEPGEDAYMNGCSTRMSKYNTWPGWGCEAKKGSTKPWKELLDHLFTGANKEDRIWFERWCAYPIQHPGAKLLSAVVMHGTGQGTGKTLVGETLRRIYGANFAGIGQQHLESDFNEHAESKQFIMGDDVTGNDCRKYADKIKTLITQKEIRINIKYVQSYVVPDCINYFFTSNHSDSFYLEDNDRRFFVHDVHVLPREDAFYADYMKWLDKEEGGAALFYYLKNLDLGDFNPSAAAHKTKAKSHMIAGGRSDLATWAMDLKKYPDDVVGVDKIKSRCDLYTSKELLKIYDPDGKSKIKAQRVARELGVAGIKQVYEGESFAGPNGQARYFAVRNEERWLKASLRELKAHLNERGRR